MIFQAFLVWQSCLLFANTYGVCFTSTSTSTTHIISSAILSTCYLLNSSQPNEPILFLPVCRGSSSHPHALQWLGPLHIIFHINIDFKGGPLHIHIYFHYKHDIQHHIQHMPPFVELTANWANPVPTCTWESTPPPHPFPWGLDSTSYPTSTSTAHIISKTTFSMCYLLNNTQPTVPTCNQCWDPLHLTWHPLFLSTDISCPVLHECIGSLLHGANEPKKRRVSH